MRSSLLKHAFLTGSSHWQFMDTAVTKISSLKPLTGSMCQMLAAEYYSDQSAL